MNEFTLPVSAQGGIYRDISTRFMKPVEEALLEKERNTPKRDYLGASGIGYLCERRVRFSNGHEEPDVENTEETEEEIEQVVTDKFSPQLLRIFKHGHMIEEVYAEHFNLAYDLVEVDDNGKQFGFSELDGKFKGHCDGVFMGMRDPYEPVFDFPALWEHKGLNASGFSQLKQRGLFLSYPHYYAQLNLYAFLIKPVIGGVERDLSKNPVIFSAVSKNTDEVHIEAIIPNRESAIFHYERAKRILEDGGDPSIAPVYSQDRNHMVCKVCPYRERCHGPDPRTML